MAVIGRWRLFGGGTALRGSTVVRKDAKQDTTCSWNVSRSNNDNVNSFPKLGEKRVNCRTCLDLVRGTGYKEKKAKLPKNKTQCQKCGVLVVQHIG